MPRQLLVLAAVTICLIAPAPRPAWAQAAGEVLAHLQAFGLPIADVVIYDAATDPEGLLGRPGQYVAKATWRDTRVNAAGPAAGIDAGGNVEVFASGDDLRVREETLDAAGGSSASVEYRYASGLILLRLSPLLAPEQAEDYAAVLSVLP
jgi:hypothetical protein